MADLGTAIRRVQQAANQIPNGSWINKLLHDDDKPNPRPTAPKSREAVQEELEKKFLTPSRTFNAHWLNALQRRWQPQTVYDDLFQLAPPQTRTVVRFKREGLEGRVVGYEEVTVPATSANAKNSTSLLRKPAGRANFVRGAAGAFPFAPGGMEHEPFSAFGEDDLQEPLLVDKPTISNLERVIPIARDGSSLLTIAPGLSRGLEIRKLSKTQQDEVDDIQKTLEQEPEPAPLRPSTSSGQQEDLIAQKLQEQAIDEDEIDALLPNEFPSLAPHGHLKPARNLQQRREWAHVVDVNKDMNNFADLVPNMARRWPFELDNFQKEAVYHLEMGDSVFVAAHTSAGKTVVAEYAIALASKHMTKAIYTSPIKALSNQKFRDFREIFDDVGILTGDVQINPEASCLIMTTEILRSMLYRGADLIRDVEFVIFDEVHYVNDLERGVVWEEVIIMLPKTVTLILLSATVPNTKEFASWVGRTKLKNIYVISTPKRPVPLEHYIWAEKDIFKIVTSDNRFLDNGWRKANDIISGAHKQITPAPGGQRGNDPRGGARGGRGGQRGGSHPSQGGSSGRGNITRNGRGGGRTSAQQDKTLWVQLVHFLRKKDLLPTCIFVFSKKRCEQNAEALSSLNFCTAAERSAIHMIVDQATARLKPEDRELPQIVRVRDLLSRGFAVHHGGMLPILKEVVEILFAKSLVKVLFATETFAMGLNLPTRTVVFSGFRKHDGREFRDLLPGEYTQMAGRAGRRGLDTVGTVILVTQGMDEAPPQMRLRHMMLGDPTKLRSQFRLTYNMILNLLRVEALQIEEMIKRSFSENASQALLPEHQKGVQLSEEELKKISRDHCSVCDVDLELMHIACIEYSKSNAALHASLARHTYGRRFMEKKRLIVFRYDGIRQVGMIIKPPPVDNTGDLSVRVMRLTSFNQRSDGDYFPFLAPFVSYFSSLPQNVREIPWDEISISPASIECVTISFVGLDGDVQHLSARDKDTRLVRNEVANGDLIPLFRSWTYEDWNEFDWSKVKYLNIKNIYDQRQEQAAIICGSKCTSCPDFVKHFSQQHAIWLLQNKIAELRQLMSDQNLTLLPDYEQRVEVLKELEFVNDGSQVGLKGKVACEIHSADELILTELILENVFADFQPEEIVALLSAFVFQERTDDVPLLTAQLERGRNAIISIADRITRLQIDHQVLAQSDDSFDFTLNSGRFGMVEVVYEWARGMSFRRITELTSVMEGTIVRVITRLDETCREVKGAARIIGDPTLYKKMEICQELIRRDVCAVASLYM